MRWSSTAARSRSSAEREPAALPWRDYGVDIVDRVDRQVPHPRGGRPRTSTAGAAKVLISAPGKGVDATIVLGVNDDDLRPGRASRHLQRLLHDELRRADGQGAARRVRHRAGLHDHGARLHQRPEHARRSAQGPAPGPRGRGQHHPDDDRCGEGGRRGPPDSRGGSTASPCACPSSTAPWSTSRVAARPRVTAAEVNAAFEAAAQTARWPGRLRYTTDPIVSTDVIGDPASCVFDSGADPGRRPAGEGVRLVRQRVGLHRRLVDLTRLVGRDLTPTAAG